MISRALAAGTSAGWVVGDEVYGADPGLRAGLEERTVSYVLAVAKSHPAATAAGVLRGCAGGEAAAAGQRGPQLGP